MLSLQRGLYWNEGARETARRIGVNVPANAPHFYKNISGGAARMLCMCTPPGQEEFFMAIGDPVDARTAPPPNLTEQEWEQRRRKARELGLKYRTEYLKS
jgi:hypothetical protein